MSTTSVSLDLYKYLDLLARASITDPDEWPEGCKHGAPLLARIRGIEADCRAEHGKWDWELLPEDLQDEYDGCCSKLNQLVESFNPDKRSFSFDEVFADVLDEIRSSPDVD